MAVALFDLDGTLLRNQSARLYMRYQRDEGEARWQDRVQVAWWLLCYSFGFLDPSRVAEKALAGLRGTPEATLAARCKGCFQRYLIHDIASQARATVAYHQAAGHRTAIVTAASSYMADPVAQYLGIDHIVATELAVYDTLLTGSAVPPLCYGDGKVERARRLADRCGFTLEECTFYTDSITDLPLLLAVGEPRVVNPDFRLRTEARRRNWPILKW